jgi:hypothetical protein
MSWMRTSGRAAHSHGGKTQEAILASVHRGLVLASASRRLQDPISSQRASAEAHHLLHDAKKLREETADPDFEDERVRFAIESLTRALQSADRSQEH